VTAIEISTWLGVAVQVGILLGIGVSIGIQILTFARLHRVVEQTNGMSHRLEEMAGAAGERRGRAEAEAERR
jgi:hypothetical protein